MLITIKDSVINLSSVKALEALGYRVKLVVTEGKPAYEFRTRPSHQWVKIRKREYLKQEKST